ncbi:pyridoxal-phosphate dependent enzyme [Streptomyces sp. NPDC127197]|uniref:pyridoxal-phosphate dependent enzyme n=1 Tax=Streptomyces sp. NPDC127197 TaxID=3345388 RepID=UPI00362A19DC
MSDNASSCRTPPWFMRPDARARRCEPAPAEVRVFHPSLPDCAPTPLTELPSPADAWGVGRVFVTDESCRPGLPAFKALGVLESLTLGAPVSVTTRETTMAGLNCGTPSSIAWPYLRGGLDAAVAIADADSARAAGDLAALGVSSGPCGAASLAGLRAALIGVGAEERRRAWGLGPSSVVVLLSTEGTAANPHSTTGH